MGAKKKMREELERLMLEQLRKANAPNPTIEMLKGYNKGILDWHLNTGNTVKDISKHPTIGSKLPTYQLAKQFRDKGRIGRGIAGLGGKNDLAYTKDLELEQDLERGTIAAGMLEAGLQGEMDQAAANLMNLEAADTNRSVASNSLLQYFHSDLNQRIASGSWTNFLKGLAVSVAPMALSALTGGGFSSSGVGHAGPMGGGPPNPGMPG